MSRVSKVISDHMIESKNISAHVQAFIEVDVTNLWDWREKIKESFTAQHTDLICDRYLLLQRGKKNYFLVLFN